MTSASTTALLVAYGRKESLDVGRIQLNQGDQGFVEGLFSQQYQEFNDVDDIVPFDRDWTPGERGLAEVEANRVPSLGPILRAASSPAHEIDYISDDVLANPGRRVTNTRALFIVLGGSILAQRFPANQIMKESSSFWRRGNHFERASGSGFTLGNSLAFVVDGEMLRFKNLNTLRNILDMGDIYKEITEPELRDFLARDLFTMEDAGALVEMSDQPMRHLVGSINELGIFDSASTDEIVDAARASDHDIDVYNGKIVIPEDKARFRDLLNFLNELTWIGSITGNSYVANSRRRRTR